MKLLRQNAQEEFNQRQTQKRQRQEKLSEIKRLRKAGGLGIIEKKELNKGKSVLPIEQDDFILQDIDSDREEFADMADPPEPKEPQLQILFCSRTVIQSGL